MGFFGCFASGGASATTAACSSRSVARVRGGPAASVGSGGQAFPPVAGFGRLSFASVQVVHHAKDS